DTALRSGDRAAARRAWLPAHLDYERLGAAYGTFGDVADAIDGLPAGLPDGVRDADFTGFHRIEYGLWHDESTRALARHSGRLVSDTRALVAEFGRERIDPNDLSLRAHEIMEQSLEFELTGRSDQGSGTSLATARANLDGTRAVLDALRPVLRGRYRDLPTVDRWLDRVQDQLDAAHRNGRWTAVTSLSRAERERLNGAVGELLERLAPVAAIAEVRRSR
ncbi:MAG: EfeM/EfeO family lipoprotein, partial [Actinocatenispora sp.]